MTLAVRRGNLMEWAWVDDDGQIHVRCTTNIAPGHNIREDDSGPYLNAQYPNICFGGRRLGNTLKWDDDEEECASQFAQDVGATLCASSQEYRERLTEVGGRLQTAPSWSAARSES